MTISEERLQVLKMIEEGKISVEEGASLLNALEGKAARNTHLIRDRRQLRVQVDDTRSGHRKVNVTLPMALVNAGLKIADNYLDEQTSQHAAALYDAIRSGETGKIIDVHDIQDGEHVQIYLE
ncbi:MAG: hypothetical protein JW757_05930 [Anaerolineales bacterium]|nr:hypothetical protein [Anaerolineales bacterium]